MDYQTTLNQLYQDINERHIDAVLEHLHTNVIWPNGWEGGFLKGHDEVREYWLRQWQEIDPKVSPVSFDMRSNGDIAVDVHQEVKDLKGKILSDSRVIHVYTFENGKVRKMMIEQK